MLQSFDYRKPRYVMVGLIVFYFLLLVISLFIGNPFVRFPGYLINWVSMFIFLIFVTILHPFNRRWIAIPYIIGQAGVIYYHYENLRALLGFANHSALSWIGFYINLGLFAFGVLAMILPLFIFLRKDIYQKPFLVVACVALFFQLISQSWYSLFLIGNIDFEFFFTNAIRIILSFVPYGAIILYTYDSKYIHKLLFPNKEEDHDDDELFGWLTLGIYTIYLAVTKPYKR